MMNYKDFETTIKEFLETKFETKINITPVETRKNNNTLCRGLSFQVPCSNTATSIYLEDAYRDYKNGISIPDICKNLYPVYKIPSLQNANIDPLFNLENVKNQIVYKIINYEQNKDLLKRIPHIPFLDLAIVFYLLLEINNKSVASMPIKNRHLAIWGIDLDTLYSCAKENTPKLLPASIQPISDVIGKIDEELATQNIDLGMLILSNTYNNLGAGCILYDNILKQLSCQFGESLYVIPSSTHECIILPKSKVENGAYLKYMICSINEKVVDPDEVLADHPYYYDLQKETLELA
ncbi:MAG: DUF5688 family protein [Lachnospiraceae bacterium]|nr:DUF5688 family protein [Lachnospiraceae bacterium]